MLPRTIYWTILIGICLFAFIRGRRDERIAAAACLGASVATRFVISPIAVRYNGVETGMVVIDIAMLSIFVGIALQSRRFWPLWVAGFQLTMSLSHIFKAIDLQLIPRAYYAAAVFWSYPILLVILIATIRTKRYLDDSGPFGAAPMLPSR